MTSPEDSGMSGPAQPPEGFDAQRTPLERQQHLALTYVGGLLQNTPAGWRLRGSNEDVGLAWRKANAALMAYHEAASVEAAPPSALRPSSPEEYDGPEWTCRECGADRFDGIFRTVTHSTPGEADDYDVACPRCGSAEVSESPREALGHVTADRDALRAERDEANEVATLAQKLRAAAEDRAEAAEKERDAHRKHYLDVADAVCRESTGTEDVVRQARETRAKLAAAQAEVGRYRQALGDIEAERQNLHDRTDDLMVAHWMCDTASAALSAGGKGEAP